MTRQAASSVSPIGDGSSLETDQAIAAEYVLGLLPVQDRSAFEVLLSKDHDLQQDVAAWRAYFSSFATAYDDKIPPPQVINRIEAKLPVAKRVALWRQVVPYIIGAALGSILTWGAVVTGVMPLN